MRISDWSSDVCPSDLSLALERSRLQRHRGPDWSGVYAAPHALLVHERLAIVDVDHGAQPLRSADGGLALAVNGEIYNHKALEAGLKQPYAFKTASDCEVIHALYREQNGRASCRERVCQYGWIRVVVETLKTQKQTKTKTDNKKKK